jgi:threonine dehydrogenase-like Zn-dependent dehydrogenase
VDWSIISDRKELNLLGGHLSPYCYKTVIDWIARGVQPTNGVVTHKLPLEDWKRGFDLVTSGTESIKVVLFPNEEFLP